MFVSCGSSARRNPIEWGAGGGTRRPWGIDIHNHVMVPEVNELIADVQDEAWDPFIEFSGESGVYNAGHFHEIVPKMVGPEERLTDMDRMGVEIDALAIGPPQYCYWTIPELGTRISRVQNDYIAQMVAADPERFVGMANLPMQDVGAAVAEMDRAIGELGFPGVQIAPSVNGRDLDGPEFRPFWAKAHELGAVVILHPHGYSDGSRMTDYYMINVVGNPLDSTVATMRLIFGGVLEEYPDLKIVVVHGGGYLPFYADRMDHAYAVRPECRQNISRKPTDYLRKLHFDSVVFGSAGLGFLISQYGADHVLLGTDYPYDMGETDPIGLIESVPGITREEIVSIVRGNAARLLGISD